VFRVEGLGFRVWLRVNIPRQARVDQLRRLADTFRLFFLSILFVSFYRLGSMNCVVWQTFSQVISQVNLLFTI